MSNGVLVHEWLESIGGAEKVFGAMCEAFPSADLLCLWSDVDGGFGGRPVRETWLGATPLRRSKAAALPLMPLAWRGIRASRRYDWALVSSHAFAHHVSMQDNREMRKFVYVHSPARYIWVPEIDGRGSSLPARVLGPALRSLDRSRTGEALEFAANSCYIKSRIQKSWDVDARVIYPPVEVERLRSVPRWADRLSGPEIDAFSSLPEDFVFGASRWVPYKRLDLVIRAAEAAGVPAVIAGGGPAGESLRELASRARVPVHFLPRPSDALMFATMQAARVFIFPGVEDFGIMPVESLALGTPVIVNELGGAAESVQKGVTGFTVSVDASKDDWCRLVDAASTLDRARCPESVVRFGHGRFVDELQGWVS